MRNGWKHIVAGIGSLLFLMSPPAARAVPFAGGDGVQHPHDFHVSYGRMAIENDLIVLNMRFFRDDLEEGLQSFTDDSRFFLDVSPRTDSLFMVYFGARFQIDVAGERLSGTIIGSGEDVEGKEDIWWYTLQFTAGDRVEALHLENRLLIEQFEDQKNIVKIQHFPSEKTYSYSFDEDETEQSIDL